MMNRLLIELAILVYAFTHIEVHQFSEEWHMRAHQYINLMQNIKEHIETNLHIILINIPFDPTPIQPDIAIS
jgi:hypothetical protein